MANVWKIGSRWSDDGKRDSSIISIFRRSNVVFLGHRDYIERFKNEVKKGDYFAIADGLFVQSVAKATSDPIQLKELIKQNAIKVKKGEPFDLEDDWGYGVKVKIVDLPKDQMFDYKRGCFFKANSIAEKVKKLFNEKLEHRMDITAKTCRIKGKQEECNGKESIINGRTRYVIPVYQREYSWGYEQITRFVDDIFKGFWGVDRKIIKEPLFIGTMQLSYEKYINENECEQDVIDGQQRLSTIICMLKYLQLKYPSAEALKQIGNLDWIETRVNNGKEEEYLNAMLSLDCLNNTNLDTEQNNYIKSIAVIDECFKEMTTDNEGNQLAEFSENIDSFVEYILNDILFVVIETVAGLSKTIQIFNTINTAGLDLNGDDLFKVRLYEYLHDIKNLGEETFNEIGEIYKNVKIRNDKWRKTHNWDLIDIRLVRSIYKEYIISKYKLPTSLYAKATDTFFDELFDVLLNVQGHNDMTGVERVKLSLEDLWNIIEVACLWRGSDFRNNDEFISYTLTERSRYNRYLSIAYLILLSNRDKQKEERLDEVYGVLRLLCRMFFCWSIMYARQVNEMHSFMRNIYNKTAEFQNNKEDVFSSLTEKIKENDNRMFRTNCIGQPIADNRVWKDLICLLSDYIDESEVGTTLEELKEKFEWGYYDIEHIHANCNEKEGTDIDGDLQNSIGNLMLLEYDINRSIGNLTFKEKKERGNNKLCYKDSRFAVVKKITKKENWGKEEIEERRKEEIEKISRFIFE